LEYQAFCTRGLRPDAKPIDCRESTNCHLNSLLTGNNSYSGDDYEILEFAQVGQRSCKLRGCCTLRRFSSRGQQTADFPECSSSDGKCCDSPSRRSCAAASAAVTKTDLSGLLRVCKRTLFAKKETWIRGSSPAPPYLVIRFAEGSSDFPIRLFRRCSL
jgi:hypothetical protein